MRGGTCIGTRADARADTRLGPLRQPDLDTESAATAVAPAFIRLDRDRMQALLDHRSVGEDVADRWDVRVVASTASTNSDLLREARSGRTFARPVLLAAETQTAGRGRLGRSWRSAPGASLTVSYGLCVARRLAELEGLSLVCGLAVRDALARHGVHVQLKWPNDVLVDGRKLAGILVEAHTLAASTVAIVGIGVNVLPQAFDVAVDVAAGSASHASASLTPTDLKSAGCPLDDRNVLATDLGIALDTLLARFAEAGFAAFASEWNAADGFRNRSVSLETGPRQAVAGIARGVDARGALLIEIDGVQMPFIAGDLSLRAIDAL